MTKNEIMRMAREAGFAMYFAQERANEFSRFAATVAAAEREACATVCDAASEPRKGYGQTDEQWAASTLAERIRARCQQ